jgi:hypothetical protein
MNKPIFDVKSLIRLLIGAELLLCATSSMMLAQPVTVTVGSGTVSVGASITVPVTIASAGAQSAALQWTMGYLSTDISSVSVTAGSSATAASKSVTCSSSLTSTTCLIYGLNANVISDGTVANVTFTIASTTLDLSSTIQLTGVTVSSPMGASISASGTGGILTILQPTWTITGSVGTSGSGATIALTGTSTASTTASSSGSYSFTGLANGSYTVTPTKSGYTFSPASAAVTVSGANVTAAAFTATAQTWTITGSVGTAGSGATIALTGTSTATTTASSSGSYSFTGLANGSYTVTPSLSGYTFSPASVAVTVSGANVTAAAFTATAQTWTITGSVGTAGSGATIALTGTSTASTTASSSGSYSFTGLANGSYTVTPTKSGYTFSPTSAAVTVNGANVTAAAFQVLAAGGSGTEFITAYSGSDVRNNYSGWVGTQMTIGSSSLNVTSVGRLCLAGNSGTHTVKFTNASTAQDVAGGSAAVNMAGCTAGQIIYAVLTAPISLQAGVSYYLTSLEVSGGDTWYDYGAVTATSAATITNSIYNGGSWASEGGQNTSYGPPNFEYSVASGTQTWTITGSVGTCGQRGDDRADGNLDGGHDRQFLGQLQLYGVSERIVHGDADQERIYVQSGECGGDGQRRECDGGGLHGYCADVDDHR